MKNILILLLLVLSSLASATTFYVSSSGNDSFDGLSESTPWKTISKVNAMFPQFGPGDRILFKRGDTFYGQIKVTKSGISGNPITISAYGIGAKPVITGFTAVAGWTSNGNGIYSKILNCESRPEMVTVNGIQYAMGKFPNTNWLTVDSYSGDTLITDAELNSSITNWKGAELVQRKRNLYTIDRYIIKDHTSQTLKYSGSGISNPYPGYGYIIQNDIRTLDSFGEWYYNTNSSVFYMYFGSAGPGNNIVNVSTINDLVTFSRGLSYITIDDISFKGANNDALYIYSNNYITVKNCDIDFSGNCGVRGYVAQYLTVSNNKITNSNDAGIFINGWYSHYANLNNNTIRSTGLIPGVGSCQNYSGCGIILFFSDNSIISDNVLSDIGYNGITFMGSNMMIRNNFINGFCFRKEDGGGIYYGGQAEYTNMTIRKNIVLNGTGSSWGKPPTMTAYMAAGIFLDYYVTGGVKIDSNTIAYSPWNGIYLHGTQNVEVINNTVYDIAYCIKYQESAGLGCPTRNVNMKDNIFFAKNVIQYPMFLNSTTDDFDQFGTFDFNYYARPLDNAKPIFPAVNWRGSPKTLAEWQTLYKHDLNSGISPVALTDTADIRFYYNETKTNKEIALTKPMIDVKGNKYATSVILLPFTSAVLMVDPDPPSIPLYTGSIIQYATPSILEMSYNMTLASIVPPASAFTVTVNSVVRPVNSVAISGSKVQLTLSSPVQSGDVITVAYSKPLTNAIQSVAGAQASSLTAQPVTNNVSAVRPTPVSSVIENTTPSVIEITFSLELASIVPPASAFTVMVNSTPRSVSSVEVSGTKVRLNLASPVINGDVVTVAYSVPSTNQLRSTSGWWVLSFNPLPVTNNVAALRPVLLGAVIENASPSVLEMTFDMELAAIIPPGSAFAIMVNSSPRTVSSVAVSGTKVRLTLASPVVYGDVVTAAYTVPSTNQLRSSSGWWVLSFSAQPVTNNVVALRPVPVGAIVESATPSIIEMTFDMELAAIVPPASAFTVMVNSSSRTVSSVAVSGTKVRLTLASPIIYGDVITAAYSVPSTNQLRSSSGWWVLSFTAQPVTNNVVALRPVPVGAVVESSYPSVIEMTFDMELAAIIPPASAFTVMVNSSPRTVSSVAVSGTKVRLTLASPVIYGDVVTAAYTVPSTNQLRSSSGWWVLSFPAQPVINNVVAARPVLIGAVVESASPSVLEMIFDLELAATIPPASAFTVMVNSTVRTVSSVTVSGTKVRLTLASAVNSGDVVTVAYTVPSSNQLRSSSGWWVLSFSAQPVTNNVSLRPVLISSVIENAYPSVIDMTFSLNLANIIPPASAFTVTVNSVPRTVSSVTLSGTKVRLTLSSPVVYGNVVTVAYTVPATNQLRSYAGWWVLSFTASPVINNVQNTLKSSQVINDTYQPGNLTCQGSFIENSTPEKIEMVFNMTLSNIIPENSAFKVLVNGLNRSVSSVTVLFNKVIINLDRAVEYGDMVTLDYIRPWINPIQAQSGEIFSTTISMEVMNNCYGIRKEYFTIFPNPARDIINLNIPEPSDKPQIIRIFDLSGKLCLEKQLDPGTSFIQIPVTLRSGIYMIKAGFNPSVQSVQKLVIE